MGKNQLSIQTIMSIVKKKDAFLMEYAQSAHAPRVYEDIMCLLNEILSGRISVQKATGLLSVYYVLLTEEKEITIREVFYRCKRVFSHQNHVIKALECIKKRTQLELQNVVPGNKGLVNGACTIEREGEAIEIKHTTVIPRIRPGDRLIAASRVVLVVEKEAVFNEIVQKKARLEEVLGEPAIIVTGKGYPCRNTLLFLMMASNMQVFGLFDCDPHGLCIYTVYKHGSRRNPALKVPGIKRIGVFLHDLQERGESLQEITEERQLSLVKNLLARHRELGNDINIMEKTRKKASIEDISGSREIAEYVAQKIRRSESG
ncbi:meiotic recombination protein SPO11 [Nematocida major]|uniref:meiotic recombination protein SPO11 n=1 Tax=Nematocida major TaxID=1912982 RepID=UPI002007C1A9|nr:meiotic recombination protein SPO11 [Nematocida major]KAH9385668.1 meiotic recombination protein SPO11 [Nematocida major]